jgi:ABC-type Fe3+-hydroxamate transport system substrate-binding protein
MSFICVQPMRFVVWCRLALVFWMMLMVLKGEASLASRRIVSLSPATTEWVYALGRGGELVGRTEACDFPVEALKLSNVGGFLEPNLSIVLGLKPSLVLVTTDFNPKRVAELERLGSVVFRLNVRSLLSWQQSIRDLGDLLDARRAADEILAKGPWGNGFFAASKGNRGIGAGSEALRKARSFRYVAFVDPKSRFVFSSSSLQSSVFERLNLINLIDLPQAFPQVSELFLSRLKPDFVVFFGGPADNTEALQGPLVPTAAEIQMVQDHWPNHRPMIIKLDSDVFLRPGPRLLDMGIGHLAQRLMSAPHNGRP